MSNEEQDNEIITEFDYKLKRPFDYAKGGEQVPAQKVRLFAPTVKHRRLCARLKQAFFRSCDTEDEPDIKKDGTTAEPKPLTPQQIIPILAMSHHVELDDVLDTAVELFLKVGKLDGDENLKPTHFDRMSQDDLEGMLGEYMSRFILASSLTRQNETS